jgi:hypothetical protein
LIHRSVHHIQLTNIPSSFPAVSQAKSTKSTKIRKDQYGVQAGKGSQAVLANFKAGLDFKQ